MKLSSKHVVVGVFVAVGLGVLAWTLLRPPVEVGPVIGDGSLADSEKVNVSVASSAPSVPPGTDALRPAPPTPAQVAVVPPASPVASSESPPSQPVSQPIVALSNEAPGDPAAVEPSSLAAALPERNPYPSPVETHLEGIGQRIRSIAAAIELDDEAARALTRIMVEHVRAERALWGEAKVFGDTKVDEQKLEQLDLRTLDSIRQSPELGDGMARVVERLLVPLVRDPGRAIDPNQAQVFSVSELRSLARGE